MIKCNWFCPKDCYIELKSLSSLPVRLLIYRKREWDQLLKIASSDEKINKLITNNPIIQQTNKILRLYYQN